MSYAKQYSYTDNIDTLNFSVRSYNVLKKNNIETVEQLLTLTENQLLKTKNLGKTSVTEILSAIALIKESFTEYITIPNYPTFFLEDGKEYKDIPLENLQLTTRAYNHLKAHGINSYAALQNLQLPFIKNQKNVGADTLLNISEVKNNTPLQEVTNEKFTLLITFELFELTKKLHVNQQQLYKSIHSECQISVAKNSSLIDNKNTVQLLLEEYFIHGNLQNYVKQHIQNFLTDFKYGADFITIFQNLPCCFHNNSFLTTLLNELYVQDIVTILENNMYAIIYPCFLNNITKLLTPKEYDVLQHRMSGKTLEEVGVIYTLTRQGVNLIELKALSKIEKSEYIFQEDFYAPVYQKYNIRSDDFLSSFKVPQETLNYLKLRYKRGKIDIEEILEDEDFPLFIRKTLRTAIYKKYVFIGDTYVKLTSNELLNYVLVKFAKNVISSEELFQMYQLLLEDLGQQDNVKLTTDLRSMEAKLNRSQQTLWIFGRKVRYYNSNIFDFTKLFDTLNLDQYENVEYSTNKFFNHNCSAKQ